MKKAILPIILGYSAIIMLSGCQSSNDESNISTVINSDLLSESSSFQSGSATSSSIKDNETISSSSESRNENNSSSTSDKNISNTTSESNNSQTEPPKSTSVVCQAKHKKLTSKTQKISRRKREDRRLFG